MLTPGMQHYNIPCNIQRPSVSPTMPNNMARKIRQTEPIMGAAAALALSGAHLLACTGLCLLLCYHHVYCNNM